MSANCDVIVFCRFMANFQPSGSQIPDSGCMIYKTYSFINNNLLSYKNWKQNYKISNTALILLHWVKVLFLPKNADFLQKKKKNAGKIKGVLVLKGMYVLTKFQVSSIILTSFWQGVTLLPPSTAKRTPKSPP